MYLEKLFSWDGNCHSIVSSPSFYYGEGGGVGFRQNSASGESVISLCLEGDGKNLREIFAWRSMIKNVQIQFFDLQMHFSINWNTINLKIFPQPWWDTQISEKVKQKFYISLRVVLKDYFGSQHYVDSIFFIFTWA